MPPSRTNSDDSEALVEGEVRAALNEILTSSTFSSSERMQSLLQYVVTEALEGRGDGIRAKTIGMDVHGYSPGEIADREGVVRVDVGRLRRRLEQFYQDNDVVAQTRILLPKGSYAPIFEHVTSPDPASNVESRRNWIVGAVLMGAVLAVVASAVYLKLFAASSMSDRTASLGDARLEIFDISPHRVEAINLAQTARDLIFPATDPIRLKLALDAFEVSIEKDPLYFGGYAGAAQVAASMALATAAPGRVNTRLQEAERHASEALKLAPEEAWALSAQAWVDFVGGNRAAANNYSRRAMKLDPNDPHIAEFDALIALFSSEFAYLLNSEEMVQDIPEIDQKFVLLNALGSAKFHTGDFTGAIDTFERSIAAGGPFGPVPMAYLIAAYERHGDTIRAEQIVEVLKQSWPNARLDILFARLFFEEAAASAVIDSLKQAGWQPKEPTSFAQD